MPNWCENDLCVSGDAKELKKFKEQAKGLNEEKGKTDLSLNNFLPTPPELLERSAPNEVDPQKMKRKYKAKDWYNWRVNNWGTKWDLEAEITEDTSTEIWYCFWSAWSPPLEAIAKIARLFPKLTFAVDYYEPGMSYRGHLKVKGKRILKEWDRDMTDEDLKELELTDDE